jgi:hypothetical protein
MRTAAAVRIAAASQHVAAASTAVDHCIPTAVIFTDATQERSLDDECKAVLMTPEQTVLPEVILPGTKQPCMVDTKWTNSETVASTIDHIHPLRLCNAPHIEVLDQTPAPKIPSPLDQSLAPEMPSPALDDQTFAPEMPCPAAFGSVPGRPEVVLIIILIINMLMPVQQDSFTHLRSLLVHHDRGILAHVLSVAGPIPPPEVTQILILRLGYHNCGTIYTA